MTFNSLTFVVFFGVVMLLHHLPLSWRAKKWNLLLASYAFYAAWSPPFVVLVWLSTVVDWSAARRMRDATGRARDGYLLLSVLVNLGLLGYFKYGGWLLDNFVVLIGLLGVEWTPARPSIVLPIGISFYTFQTMSYTIDVYRRRMEPWPDFLDFALFVTFFPQLVAGPIVRARRLLPQFLEPRRATAAQLGWGLTLMTTGLFEKIVLADGFMAPVVDKVYANISSAGTVDAWIGTMAFAAQIFLDFSGYSLCGIGAALCLGFHLPDNFRFPLAAIGFGDFWRRWHITLSAWMRNYVFTPLARRLPRGGAGTAVAAMVTMFLVGLWHGAAWGFVLWGTFMGALLIGERLLLGVLPGGPWRATPLARGAGNFVTIALLVLGLALFRAPHGLEGLQVMRAMVLGAPNELELGRFDAALGLGMLPLLMLVQGRLRDRSLGEAWAPMPTWVKSALIAAMLIGMALAPRNDRAFIYFQF